MTVEPQAPQKPKAELGCWTLILIALIVMVFSVSGDNRKTRRKLDAMNEKIDRLEKKIDALTAAQQKTPGTKPAPKPAPTTTTTTTTGTTSR